MPEPPDELDLLEPLDPLEPLDEREPCDALELAGLLTGRRVERETFGFKPLVDVRVRTGVLDPLISSGSRVRATRSDFAGAKRDGGRTNGCVSRTSQSR